MTVADQLGTGASFGRARNGRSARGRAKAVAQGDIPTYELVRLPLHEVSPTPLNPRRNFGTAEDMTRFGEELRHAQLAACVAVTADAYLTLWPEHREKIGDVAHVLVNGERRFRSALHVGLDGLDFVVRDDLAATREDFIDHLLKENLEREDFDVIERARGVQQMVEVCEQDDPSGARARAARRLQRDRSWVTNQLALLRLPLEIQVMLSKGELPERDGRLLARYAKDQPDLDAAALLAHHEAVKAQSAEEKARERALLQAAKQQGVLSADNTSAPPAMAPSTEASGGDVAGSVLSVDNTDPAAAADSGPIPAPAAAGQQQSNATKPSEASDPASALSADNDTAKSVPKVPAQNPGDGAEGISDDVQQQLVRAGRGDIDVLADALGQNLQRDKLERLVEQLRSWL
ncbi:plasmid partitioning protein [Streptomyces armeniacus]|uniref:Plasmid partitioning protein n=1 Tax=Streptomyces armeniacus TaxID=83291 RepID=A0A345XSP5_9ACTN|nr:plasmid partitioning protein [Streptomyces armeniacus]AXK34661.1 plasmid partitioning protein [Streptomyces armeniacus]